MDLGNAFEATVHHFLIGRIVGLGYQDRIPMMSAVLCMVIHWIGFTMSHGIRL